MQALTAPTGPTARPPEDPVRAATAARFTPRRPITTPTIRTALAAAGLLALGLPAAAQEAAEGWTFGVTPYVWVPGFSTSVGTSRGTVDVDTSSSDALSDLDMAFMGAFEARKGRWGLILDLLYTDLSSSEPTPLGRAWSKANVDTKTTAFSVYAAYRVLENEKGFVDVLAGGRFFSLDVDLKLTPGRARGRSYDLSADWGDPLIGARGRYDFNDKWYATASADMGGFDSGSDSSWQAIGTLGYQFNEKWSAHGGWRHLAIEKEIDGLDVEVDLSGPILGFTYRF